MPPPPENLVASVRFLGASYDNLIVWKPVNDAASFRIMPAPVPWKMIIALNIVFAALICGWIYLGLHFGSQGERFGVMAAGIGIGLLVCAGFTGIVWYTFSRNLSQGPVFIYNRAARTIALPRQSQTFPVDATCLQLLTLVGMQGLGTGGSELQVHVEGANEPEAWPLAASKYAVEEFGLGDDRTYGKIVRGIQEHTPLEILFITMKDRNTPISQKVYAARHD